MWREGARAMKVISPGGEFEIELKEADVDGEHIVVKGRMGVWDSKIYIGSGDVRKIVSIMLTPQIALFGLKLSFRYMFKMLFGGREDGGKEGGSSRER